MELRDPPTHNLITQTDQGRYTCMLFLSSCSLPPSILSSLGNFWGLHGMSLGMFCLYSTANTPILGVDVPVVPIGVDYQLSILVRHDTGDNNRVSKVVNQLRVRLVCANHPAFDGPDVPHRSQFAGNRVELVFLRE